MRTLCHDLSTTTPGTDVVLEGWVHRRRELSRVTFLVLRDRSGLAQVVLQAGTPVPPEETTVRVTGTATANTQAPGGVEVTEAVVELLTEPAAAAVMDLVGATGRSDTTPAPWWFDAESAAEPEPPDNVTYLGRRFGGWAGPRTEAADDDEREGGAMNRQTTTATTSVSSRRRSTSSIGTPAVPEGSPSSDDRA